MANTHIFTKGEEIANAITHGVAALLSVAGLVVLIVSSVINGTVLHVVTFTIFGATMVILYTSSTFVHALPKGKAKDIFEILDHSSIYLFIAGTYTPFTLLVIQGAMGWSIFGIVWGIALVGIVFKVYFVKRFLFTSTLLYIAMGWLIVIGWSQITNNIESSGVYLLIAGGLCYTLGTVFYMWRGFKFHHMIWHLFVIAGTLFHYFCVLFFLLP
ncbi:MULTISPECIES: hemolysin III family protein [Oceanobacillus]|uniref:Hemolysin III n=1 Tax=Oceanobacillus kimchii TaxID=746691 RepID=A0ABQ5TMF8_9BACI|nr:MULTISPECIES: hemolysin III family protein [Oceanobacillus]MBT2600737.1 hemolysin III family protein [Oceanobacillus sp. ISL-74]MBT2650866.1 hemolysin III family protein [Oceanobacillus sp. ISL-73]MCT1575492.1 hemolysin III family protein [Oceanobacillus kimchii]MCT2138065.1 hemolysin III family protein [Oceanobacillus kimchii]OEH55309.1 hemolysin D [Oceanobacillus sp. E9]